MRVKICGLTREKDVQAALDNGADAVGFVVASPDSPRNLSLSKARKLAQSVPIFVSKVAVTITGDIRVVKEICSTLHPNALQLYSHNAHLVHRIRISYPETKVILATGIRDKASILEATGAVKNSDAILADTPGNKGMGGTGHVHDWKLTATLRKRIYPHPLILAGGLNAQNVRLAIKEVAPYGVDVSSGVERAIGIKDHEKIREFITNAKETSS